MDTPEQDGIGRSAPRGELPIIQGRVQTTGLDLGHFRLLAQAKPRTKAAQVRQVWPEIKIALTAGHRLKDIRNWLNEAGIEIGYARLSDYVCQLKRLEASEMASAGIPETQRSSVVRNKSLDHQEHRGIGPDPCPTRMCVSGVIWRPILRWMILLIFSVIVFSLGFLIGRTV